MKKTLFLTFFLCLTTTCLSSLLLSAEPESNVGARVATSIEEHIALQQIKEQLAEEKAQEEGLVRSECHDKQTEVRKSSKSVFAYQHPPTCHLGAFHQGVGVSFSGDKLELEEGSVWNVNYWDQHKPLKWLDTHVLVVTPNHSWFSTSLFCIKNLNTGESVEVNLVEHQRTYLTHSIVDIDYENGLVWLEDRSIWKMSDFYTLYQWMVNDVVIIGIDDRWFSGTSNILINAYTLDYSGGYTI